VEIIDNIMGTNLHQPPVADVKLHSNKKKGILIISENNFLKRIWFLLSNPFRYIFNGKIRY